jgi:hypothetical protein
VAEPAEAPPIPDPLGIADVDLRITQELYSSGRLFKANNGSYARRSTAFIGSASSSPNKSAYGREDMGVANGNDDSDSDSSSDDENGNGGGGLSSSNRNSDAVTSSGRGGFRGPRVTK